MFKHTLQEAHSMCLHMRVINGVSSDNKFTTSKRNNTNNYSEESNTARPQRPLRFGQYEDKAKWCMPHSALQAINDSVHHLPLYL